MPARRFGLLALAAGVVVALALTHPLALAPASTVLDDGTLDAFQFVWNLWWAKTSLLDLGTNPFYTRHLFYPDEVSLLFHTFSASLGFASIPLQLALPGGVVTAHNVIVVASPALLVLATALLAREVTGDPWASLAAGLMATLTGAMTWFLPVIYLTATWLAAAVAWAWWRMHRRRRWSDVALVLTLLAALVLASQEYAMMALGLLGLDTVLRLAAPRALGMPRAWLPGTAGAWGVAALALGALGMAAAKSPGAPPPAGHLLLGSGFLAGFVTPPWLAPPPVPFWIVLYVGTAPLLAIAGTAWLGGRRALFWAIAAVAMLLMACGPFVGLHHPLTIGEPAPPDLSRVPPGHVRGPYWLALELVPFLRVFRGAYRWVAVAEIALAVVAAAGIAGWRRRIADARVRAVVTAAVLAATVGLGFADVRRHANAVVSAVVPAAYDVVRDDPAPCAVIELPAGLTLQVFANLATRYMFHQTRHGKFLLDGTVARLPPGVKPLVARRITTFADLPWVKYVTIHRDLLPNVFPVAQAQVATVERLLATEGELLVRDGPLEIYRLATFRPESVR